MSFDLTGLPSARKRWPKRHDTLPAAVQTVFEAWDNCLEQQQDDALNLIEGFAKPPGRFTSKQKSRDLTLLRSPLPSGISVHPLSAEDVAVFFGGTAPPFSVTPKSGDAGSDVESVRSTPSVRFSPTDDRMASMEASLTKCMETIAKQNEQLSSQAATLERLFKAQADPDEIQSSNYEVTDSVLSKLGRNAQGKMSWLDIKPLPKSERRRIIREQGGTFATFPPDLDLLASTKALKLVQEAKLTLPNFATQEVAKYMSRNAGTIRMCGTVLSRVRELHTDLTPGFEPGEDRDSDAEMDVPTSVPSQVLLEFLHTLEAAAAGAMDLAIDTQTLMRLSVSRRIETALGVAHLHQDPSKIPKEDFMSPKTLTLIEEAAKMREDLTWAMEAQKSVTSNRNSLFGNRLPKAPGGGGPRNYAANSQRGQGRGAGGKGSGTGKGKGGNKAKWDKTKADAESDPTE